MTGSRLDMRSSRESRARAKHYALTTLCAPICSAWRTLAPIPRSLKDLSPVIFIRTGYRGGGARVRAQRKKWEWYIFCLLYSHVTSEERLTPMAVNSRAYSRPDAQYPVPWSMGGFLLAELRCEDLCGAASLVAGSRVALTACRASVQQG